MDFHSRLKPANALPAATNLVAATAARNALFGLFLHRRLLSIKAPSLGFGSIMLCLLASTSCAWAANPNTGPESCASFQPRLSRQTIALCEQAQLEPVGAKSVQGRPILVKNVLAPAPKSKVLIIGGIHGDEITSVAISFHWLRFAMDMPADTHWRFIPVLNPDGLLASPPTRLNANNVDLNRNFPTPEWEKEARAYWETRTFKDPRRWPGKESLSEPETKLIVKEMETFQPDLIVSIHAPYGVLDFDGPSVPPRKLGSLLINQVGIFPGSLGNYAGVYKGVPIVTVELPNADRLPSQEEIRQMWVDLLNWKKKRIQPSPEAPVKTATTWSAVAKPVTQVPQSRPAPPLGKQENKQTANAANITMLERVIRWFAQIW